MNLMTTFLIISNGITIALDNEDIIKYLVSLLATTII